MTFLIKRVYEPPAASDGIRVLVDRLWPRGLKKTDARLDHWMKDVAPSTALRQWFHHEPDGPGRFAEFSRRYKTELKDNPTVSDLRKLGKGAVVSLLYGAHDPQNNHAAVLQSVLRGTAARGRTKSAPTAKPARRRAG